MDPLDRLTAGHGVNFRQDGVNLKRQLLTPDSIRHRDKHGIVLVTDSFGGMSDSFTDYFGPVFNDPPAAQFVGQSIAGKYLFEERSEPGSSSVGLRFQCHFHIPNYSII